MFSDPLIARLADFVRGIGIDLRATALPEPTFRPGLAIRPHMLRWLRWLR